MSVEEIKRLGTKSLEEKWNLVSVDDESTTWTKNCAFCDYFIYCHECPLEDYLICNVMWDLWEDKNLELVIRTLKELEAEGFISEETEIELGEYK